MPLLPPLTTYVVGCKNGHKFFLSHQEMETYSPPLDFDLGHVICSGQWDLSKRDTAEAYKVHWNSPSQAVGVARSTMGVSPGLAPCMTGDLCRLCELS